MPTNTGLLCFDAGPQVAQADLELLILLSVPSKCCDNRPVPQAWLSYGVSGCDLGKCLIAHIWTAAAVISHICTCFFSILTLQLQQHKPVMATLPAHMEAVFPVFRLMFCSTSLAFHFVIVPILLCCSFLSFKILSCVHACTKVCV